MKGLKLLGCIILFFLFVPFIISVDWSPQGNVNLKNRYTILNWNASVNDSNIEIIGGTFDIDGELNVTGNITGYMNWSNIHSFPDDYLLNTGDTATGDYNFDSGTLFINSSSNKVGIGTDSPSNELDVDGEIGIKNANFLRLYNAGNSVYASINFHAGNVVYANYPWCFTSSDDHIIIGDVGIGATSPDTKLHVNGTAKIEDDLNMTSNNITDVNCIHFNSGGMICSS